MPEASVESTRQRAEIIRDLISQMEVKHLGLSLGTITASMGVAAYPEHGESVEDVIRSADAAMYRAKESGRNRVELAEKIVANQTVVRASGNPSIAESRTAPRS